MREELTCYLIVEVDGKFAAWRETRRGGSVWIVPSTGEAHLVHASARGDVERELEVVFGAKLIRRVAPVDHLEIEAILAHLNQQPNRSNTRSPQ